ncbi:hypothetical protein D3C86_1612280 [compost metagenome]
MDQAPDPGAFTGLYQGARPLDMGQTGAVPRPVLQDPDAVDHGVHPLQQRRPGLDRGQPGEVGGDPVERRRSSRRLGGPPGPGANPPALARQRRRQMRADESIGPENENPPSVTHPFIPEFGL